MRSTIAICAVLLFAGGCATQGRLFDDRPARDFVVGETTPEQAMAALGPPTSDWTRPDGLRLVGWEYQRVVLIQPFRRWVHTTFRDGRLVSVRAPFKDEEVSIF